MAYGNAEVSLLLHPKRGPLIQITMTHRTARLILDGHENQILVMCEEIEKVFSMLVESPAAQQQKK